MLNHLALLEAHFIHQGSDTVRSEHTHQVILKRHVEYAATRVSLTTRTTAQLSIHAAALMSLRTNNRQTAGFLHLRRQFDIRTTTCHVRRYRYNTRATCLSDHIRLLLVQLRIQHVVLNLPQRQHSAQQLADFHRCSTYQYRSPLPYQRHYLVYHRVVFLAFRTIDTIVHIHTRDRLIRRNNHHIQFIDIPELTSLRLRRTRHTRQLIVHTEVVL